jgi:chromosome segregation ATPase
MIFSLGNLLSIFIVLIILIIYRALDRNNRSLEKVKRFSDKIRDSLAAVVEEKTVEMKNLSIELGVNLKTGKEVLKRVREVEEELAKKASGVGEIQTRLEGYDQAMAELVGMTARVEENLKRVQSESVFVDKVGKRLTEASARLARVEQDVDRVQDKLAEQNRQSLQVLRQELTREVSAQVQGLTGLLGESEKRIKDYGKYLSRLEAGASELEKERLASLAKGFEQMELEARGKRSGLLKEFVLSLNKLLGEAEARGDKLKGALGQTLVTAQEKLGGQKQWIEEMDRLKAEAARRLAQAAEELEAGVMKRVAQSMEGYEREMERRLQKLEAAGSDVEALEASLRQAIEHSSELEKERLESLAKGFERLELEAGGRHAGALKEFSASLKRALGEAEARGEALKGALGQALVTAQEKLGGQQQWLEEMDRLKGEMTRRLNQATDELETEALKHVAKGMEVYEREMERRLQKLEAAGSDIEALEASLRQAIEHSGQQEKERLESLAKGFERLELEAGGRRAEALKEFSVSLNRALGEAEARGETLKGTLAEAFVAAQEKLGGQQQWLEEMDRLKAEATRRLAQAAEELELGVLKRVEQSMEGYEREVEYRFQKLEAAGGDIEALEANLHQAMERSSEALRKEFAAHLQGLSEERQAERAKAQAEMAQLDEGMRELEGGLNELKAKAYENVSAQLAVLEDQFFKDLRERSASLEDRMGALQAEVEAQVSELGVRHGAEREALERRYSEELKRELERARAAAAEELSRQEARSVEFQGAVSERVSGAEKRIAGFVEGLPGQLANIRQEAQVLFHRELAALQQSVAGEVQRLRKDMESSAGAIRQEFASQREELVSAGGAETAGLKAEFQSIQERIAKLEEDLAVRSERALESFRSDWESFQEDFIRRTKETQTEMEGRVREVKGRLAETREKTEALQASLQAKVEEGYHSLSASLLEMDKRVKAFAAQTKLFERSDELKSQLEARIEEMKRDSERLAVDHKQIEDMEGRLAMTRKVIEELGGKLGRLLAERGKVEGMDSDFRKLLNLSKDLDQRLDTVTSSQDALQEIQAKIRELEELERATEGRFERLEKKKAILESTINGVDKGFQQLTELEKGLETFKGEVSTLGTALTEIRAQADILASNKEKADQVVRRVADIDGILTDLEGRMGKLEKAREWLAKTETRFERVGKQAQEQVKLLESILKAEKKQSKGDEGAPGLDKRDTVIKLAHLGWSPQEIARTTRLSRGEVELILELAPKQ